MRNLEEIRLEINEIDEKLIKLFIQRMECAREVGLYKKENNIPILNADREQEILMHRYGIGGGKALTQREIAANFGISRSYVSRLEKRALEKLRVGFEEKL